MITFELDDKDLREALRRMAARLSEAGLRQAMDRIGSDLVESTEQRFASSTAPDGSRWKPNARSTMERLLAGTRGGTRKDGKISAKGRRVMIDKKPLVDTGQLADTIRHQHIPGGVLIGTDHFFGAFEGGAAVHQFGSRNGRIPARPFLGLSAADRTAIMGIIEAHLADQ